MEGIGHSAVSSSPLSLPLSYSLSLHLPLSSSLSLVLPLSPSIFLSLPLSPSLFLPLPLSLSLSLSLTLSPYHLLAHTSCFQAESMKSYISCLFFPNCNPFEMETDFVCHNLTLHQRDTITNGWHRRVWIRVLI